MIRPWALPLVPLYRAGLAWKEKTASPPKRLAWPVMSVGSVSAGGAGKTPVVMALASLLGEMGIQTDVLSRGYKRSSRAIEQVDPAGEAARFGDEPMEMARAGLNVWVGSDRHAAGLKAETQGGRGVHLLDDGFQHRQLARDLDVVLLTAQDVADSLLPAGNLREPLEALGRADVIVLREEEAEPLREFLLSRGVGAEVWVVRRRVELPKMLCERPLAFCGIARPEGFFTGLVAAGCKTPVKMTFRDHQEYGISAVERLAEAAELRRADGYITTAKDEVKITGPLRRLLETAGPIQVARLRAEFLEKTTVKERLEAVIREASRTARSAARPA